jgi:nucleotide-binding universal stress UspA family protein
MILIGYDGSDNAKDAIRHAGDLFKGQPATVLSVWEPFADIVARAPAGLAGAAGITDYERLDDASRRAAEQQAEEGATLARDGGLDATARTSPRAGAMAQTILNEADAVQADAIVLGSRGLTGVGSFFLGSVSHAVVQSADRPVLIVPSPEVAQERTEKRRGRD